MARKKKKFDWRIVYFFPIPLLWVLAAQFGQLDRLEHMLLDFRFRFRGPIQSDVKLVYVNVDSRAIQQIGERPWNRGRFAQAAQLLYERGGARAVGFDFVFSEQGHSDLVDRTEAAKGNVALGRLARKYPSLVLAAQYTGGDARTQKGIREFPFLRNGFTDRAKNDTPEMPEYPIVGATLTMQWGTVGLIDVDLETSRGEVPRWVPLFAESIVPTDWHMSVQLAAAALGLPPNSARRAGDFVELVNPTGEVVRRIPVREQQILEANWFSAWNEEGYSSHTSLADVLIAGDYLNSDDEARRQEGLLYFRRFFDAIILIGPTDPLLQDLATSPLDAQQVPKVGLHGNLVKTIVGERYLTRPADWLMWVSTFGLTLLVTSLTVAGGARSLWFKILAVGALVGFALLGFYLFRVSHVVVALSAPLGAAFCTGFAATIRQLVEEERQKGRIKGMFGAYVAPELVERMVDADTEPQLGGHDAEITAYFSDIQSFSAFSEKLGSGPLVELMNEYLTACTDIVQGEGGTLDKYIGDAVVAMFGAPIPLPDHAYRACVASQKVHAKLSELRAKWKGEGDRWPEIVHNMQTRVGLNSGTCMIGNMGSRTRFNYTMMGDNVNLAARMESGAKQFGVYTMVAEATKIACEEHGGDRVVFRFLDQIVVKGRSVPVKIFEIVGLKENLTPQTRECLAVFAQGVEHYRAQDFAAAIATWRRSAELEPNVPGRDPGVEGNPSLSLIKRAEYMKTHPPGEGWDGVFVMKEK
ncbi:MAG: adenylate/guanylate cyclase domain-containing protein [Candidatus Didemnitutus sp.]|nr:adenylate/guanylate cyclase domain-containing protein [Candidatus Didemnitutus sp.]